MARDGDHPLQQLQIARHLHRRYQVTKVATNYFFSLGTAHCANMYPESESDSEQLKQARTKVGDLIHKWIK